MYKKVANAPGEDVIVGRDEVKLLTITPDVLYAVDTQPAIALKYLRGEKARFRLNKSRKIGILVGCLALAPNEFDSMFNVEVRPPYDYQTEVFMREFAKQISSHLESEGEISDKEIEELKTEIYEGDKFEFTHPLESIKVEMDDNKEFLRYLLNIEDKLTVTQEEVEIARRANDEIPKSFYQRHSFDKINAVIDENWADANFGQSYQLAALIPAIHETSTTHVVELFAHVNRIQRDRTDDSILTENGLIYDIITIMKIFELRKTSKKLAFNVLLVDDYSNVLQLVVGENTMNKIYKVCDTLLTAVARLAVDRNVRITLDRRLKNGSVII